MRAYAQAPASPESKHVLAEKPCAMDIPSLDAVIRTAEDNHVIVCEMEGVLYEKPYHKVREIVKSGALGDIIRASV